MRNLPRTCGVNNVNYFVKVYSTHESLGTKVDLHLIRKHSLLAEMGIQLVSNI